MVVVIEACWHLRSRAEAIERRAVTNRAGEAIAGLVVPIEFRAPRTPPVADPPHNHLPILTPKSSEIKGCSDEKTRQIEHEARDGRTPVRPEHRECARRRRHG
jgi:hypothetical protein